MQIAAHKLEAAVDDVELVDGKYQVKGVPGRGLGLSEIAKAAYAGGMPQEIGNGLETTNFFSPEDETFPFGTHIAMVEVFPETGEIKILRHLACDDIGNIISPQLVQGQVHGGVAQGVGIVLWEEMVYDDSAN